MMTSSASVKLARLARGPTRTGTQQQAQGHKQDQEGKGSAFATATGFNSPMSLAGGLESLFIGQPDDSDEDEI